MKNNYNFTYIIGFRYQSDRIIPLLRSLEWISKFSGAEIILVEQDSHPKLNSLNLGVKYYFIENKSHYNRSWGLNVGTKYANSNKIVFSDTDLLMRPEDFIASLVALDEYEMVNPYQRVIDLNPNESRLPYEQIFNIDKTGRGENDNQKTNICGGMSMYRKDAINRIGGWHEGFWGWGAEDDFLAMKTKKFLNWKQMEGNCYHLFHKRGVSDMEQYKKNINLMNKLFSLNDEDLKKLIQIDRNKNGRLNLAEKRS